MFDGVRHNRTQQIRRLKINRIRTYCCRISKIFNSIGRDDNFLAKARKLSILPTSLDTFDIREHYIRILYDKRYGGYLETTVVCIIEQWNVIAAIEFFNLN